HRVSAPRQTETVRASTIDAGISNVPRAIVAFITCDAAGPAGILCAMSEPSMHHSFKAGLKQATGLFRARQHQQALQLLRELAQQEPDQPEVLRALGIGLVQVGQPEAAEP